MIEELLLDKYRRRDKQKESPLFQVFSGIEVGPEKQVLITLLNPDVISSEQFLARFNPVAETLQELDASGVATLLAYGEHEKQAVVVQEYVEGESLTDMLAESEGFPVDLVLDIARQLGESLQGLHQADLVHGCLNPDRVLLSAEGSILLFDVGLAQGLKLNDLLASGQVEPRPYHAAELLAGESLSACVDFYALGVILYQSLTGETPSGPEDIWPGNHRPGLPPELDALVAKCLNADPAKRVQSAAELLHSIEEIHRGIQAGAQDTILGVEDVLVGHTLGPYQLVERLGQGGMATVYKAYEPSLDRYVAIKVLPQFLARDPQFMERFRREAKAVAQLNHPNIVPIHSFGEQDGITYIAMQFVEGGTLKHARDGACPPEEAICLVLPVLRALAYAHEQGIVHRDIKPSNVLMAKGEWPLLADFGLAKMAQGPSQITATGVGVGTPAYMSPEQGQGVGVDHRSDIYSLGIMLYEMLTGDVPFRADTPMAVVIKHITAPLPMPREVNPSIPEPLERVILKATAKNQDDRYQSAEELLVALERILQAIRAGDIEIAQDVAPVQEERERQPFALKPVHWAAGFGVLALIVLGIIFGSGLWASPQVTLTLSQQAAAVQPATDTSMPTTAPTSTETVTTAPNVESTAEPTTALTPTFTQIPLRWSRIDMGQFLDRDTVTQLVINPDDTDIIYAGTKNSGIYKSINGGISWQPVQEGLGGGTVASLVINPEDPDVLYAGVIFAGLFKTEDGGLSWQEINRGELDKGMWQFTSHVALDPTDPDHLFFANGNAIYQSADAGESWTKQPESSGCLNGAIQFSADGTSLFKAGMLCEDPPGGWKVFRSQDQGKTWEQVYSVDDGGGDGEIVTHGDRVVFRNNPMEIFVSEDKGETWMLFSGSGDCSVVDQNGERYCFDIEKIVPSFDAIVSVSPDNSDVMFVGGQGVYKSVDGGRTWEDASNGIGNEPAQIVLNPFSRTIYIEKGSGYCGDLTEDFELFQGSIGGDDFELVSERGCGLYLGTDAQSLYRFVDQNGQLQFSRNAGETYQATDLQSPDGYQGAGIIEIRGVQWMYAILRDGSLYFSEDDGQTWQLESDTQTGHTIVRLAVDAANPDLLYGLTADLYKTSDRGETWTNCYDGLNDLGYWNPVSYTSLASNPIDSGEYFAVTENKGLLHNGDEDCGNPEIVDRLDSRFVNTVLYHPVNPEIVYAGTNGGFYISYNGGESWGKVDDGLLGALTIYSLQVDEKNPGVVYASTPYGIFELIDQ